jgi:hypothetical protein
MLGQEIDAIKNMYRELYFWRDCLYANISRLAEIEGLPCHAESIKVRLGTIEAFVTEVEDKYRKLGQDLQPIKAEVEKLNMAYDAEEKKDLDTFLKARLKHKP